MTGSDVRGDKWQVSLMRWVGCDDNGTVSVM